MAASTFSPELILIEDITQIKCQELWVFYVLFERLVKEGNVLFNDKLNIFYLRNISSNILERTTWITREETHVICNTTWEALAGIRNSAMGPPGGIDHTTYRTMSGCFITELRLPP